MAQKRRLLGVFAYLDDLVDALKMLKGKGMDIHSVLSPTVRHEIADILGLKPSPVRWFTFTGAALGAATGVFLVVYTCIQWKFIVSGKPVIPLVPAVVVAFEFLILIGVFFNLAGLLIMARLPKARLPYYYDPRLSQTHFGIYLICPEGQAEDAIRIMKESGAEEVHDVER